jgi:hypothetical protein
LQAAGLRTNHTDGCISREDSAKPLNALTEGIRKRHVKRMENE